MHLEYDIVFAPAASILKLNVSKDIGSGRGDRVRYSYSDIVVITKKPFLKIFTFAALSAFVPSLSLDGDAYMLKGRLLLLFYFFHSDWVDSLYYLSCLVLVVLAREVSFLSSVPVLLFANLLALHIHLLSSNRLL